ncbi:MAG: alpha-glucuronidase [Lachnospiraceae bacterium]|nr:alpha-glucuronidase [Lachnospiraceae bacterium]
MKEWTDLWLTYRRQESKQNIRYFQNIFLYGFAEDHPMIQNALLELKRGIEGMLGFCPQLTAKEQANLCITKASDEESVAKGAYRIQEENGQITLSSSDESGILYGVFHILREIGFEKEFTGIHVEVTPANPLRMLNHWDNMDGSIERGYSGNSFFYEGRDIVLNERIVDYARIVSSVGINGVVINNVNVKEEATYLITPRFLDKVAKLAQIFEGYGISLYLSLNFAACEELDGIGCDPLDPAVRAWWKRKMEEVYTAIPHLGGFLVKADSEGRPGPFTYGRTHADGANMLGEMIAPYGGLIIWRCFVYNCTQDWRDRKTDRARAGYDHFIGLDGTFADNVILQIKNGPMDFQIREPISPLLGGLSKTNQILEVQIAQEYTGQQIDVCYLIPMFKEVLDFHTCCKKEKDTVADIISGQTFASTHSGIAAVTNTGRDTNWTGNDLAAANLYGFGRLAFQPTLTAEEIADEWIRLTYSQEQKVRESILSILLPSREIYEKYTSPLGIGWMVVPGTHYGPEVDGYEYSRWGTYHRADWKGLGVDRSDSGTAYARQYHEPLASMYNSKEDCPEELLLFFHHVPYTYPLKSGKTVIQHIYDTHFEGAEAVEKMLETWESIKDRIPTRSYENVKERLLRQRKNAKEWCDQVNAYFYRKSGIKDEKNREIY